MPRNYKGVRIYLEAVRPRKSPLYPLRDFDNALKKAQTKMESFTKKEFQKTTITWKTKVKFYRVRGKAGTGSRAMELVIGTDSEIYAMVNFGTRAHTINGDPLVFRKGYLAKTIPNQQFSRKTKGAQGTKVFARQVSHPGTAARNFDKIIAEKLDRLGIYKIYIDAEWEAMLKKIRG